MLPNTFKKYQSLREFQSPQQRVAEPVNVNSGIDACANTFAIAFAVSKSTLFLLALSIAMLCTLIQNEAHAQNLQVSSITPFEVEYDVGNNLITAGSAKLSLKQQGDEWIYSLNTLPAGIFKLTGKGRIQEISVMTISNQQLQPKRYTYRQDETAKRSVDAWFNWENNELTYRRKGVESTEPLKDPILDRLSVTLSVREQLRSGFEQAAVQVFDNGRIKTIVFTNEGTETLSTKLGRQEAIKVKSYHKEGTRKRVTTTWFAPALDYVPVVIEQHKEGKLVARLTISKLNNQ